MSWENLLMHVQKQRFRSAVRKHLCFHRIDLSLAWSETPNILSTVKYQLLCKPKFQASRWLLHEGHLYSTLNRKSYKPKVYTLIMCVCAVCLCPKNGVRLIQVILMHLWKIITLCLIGQWHKFATVYSATYCQKPDVMIGQLSDFTLLKQLKFCGKYLVFNIKIYKKP